MTERPILFSAPMVRAILANSKTQTRRVVKPVGDDDGFVLQDYGSGWWPYRSDDGESPMKDGNEIPHACPYGAPGDRLWVRETWAPHFMYESVRPADITIDARSCLFYAADGGITGGCEPTQRARKWRPAIHMPRAASRIALEVTGVRLERLGDISEADAIAEGIGSIRVSENDSRWLNYCDPESKAAAFGDPRHSFWSLWESINGRESRDANPFVWVVEFKRM